MLTIGMVVSIFIDNLEEMLLRKKIKQRKEKFNDKDISSESFKQALCKKALGFCVDEITEEYVSDDDSLKLTKRKIVSKQVPPDVSAIKTLLEISNFSDDVSNMTDEELLKEKERLLLLLKEEGVEGREE